MVKEDDYHPAVEFLLPVGSVKTLSISNYKFLNFHKANFALINNKLLNSSWEKILSCTNLDTNILNFYNVLNSIISEFVPSGYRNTKFPRYFSSATIKIVKEKNKFHNKWKIYRNLRDFNTFKLLRSRSKRLIKEDYKNYINYIEAEIPNNYKKFWQFVSVNRKSSNYPSDMFFENNSVSDNQSICNSFAKYFQSVFQPPSNINFQADSSTSATEGLSHLQLSKSEIVSVLRELDPQKGPGADGVPAILAKQCATGLCLPLLKLFNQSLGSGVFPTIWKKTIAVPIFKSGDKRNIQNYRPISKLCTFAKVFEKVVYKYIFSLVKNVIIPEQHGFFANRSIDSNLISYSQYILNSLDDRVQVDSVYTDFSKAFDKIDHSLLINKLSEIGVAGVVLDWFKSYLSCRENFVAIADCSSDLFIPTSGVPQESHLSIIFVNDISKCFFLSTYFMQTT